MWTRPRTNYNHTRLARFVHRYRINGQSDVHSASSARATRRHPVDAQQRGEWHLHSGFYIFVSHAFLLSMPSLCATLDYCYTKRTYANMWNCALKETKRVGLANRKMFRFFLCAVIYLPPLFIFHKISRTHGMQEINYDSARGGVSVITEKGEITTSYLLIQRARISDSGKYTCLPTHANPQTVNVHVLNGKR